MRGIEQALSEFVRQRRGDGMIPATVLSVDRENFVFDCEDGDGSPYLDVRMNATTGSDGLIAVPAVGSSVIITDLGNQGKAWVMLCAGTITDLYLVTTNQVTIHLNEQSMQLGGGQQVEGAVLGATLNQHLSELLTAFEGLLIGLQAFAAANQGASAGALQPLAPAYTGLLSAITPLPAQLALLRPKLPTHLSTTVTLTK